MSKREFKMEYEFTSTKADGNSYSRTVNISADSEKAAYAAARIEGFTQFGARFTDNCVDWRIVR